MKDYQNHEIVEINSLVPWSIYFHSETMRTDVEIPQMAKNYRRLDFGTVKDEISKGNSAFCGVDGFGNHAPLEIPDAEMREALFMQPTEPKQVTLEILKKTTKQKTQDNLKKWLNEYFATISERKVLMVYLADLPEEERDSLPVWFFKTVDEHYVSDVKPKEENENRMFW